MISTSIFKALRFDSQTSTPARCSAAALQPTMRKTDRLLAACGCGMALAMNPLNQSGVTR